LLYCNWYINLLWQDGRATSKKQWDDATNDVVSFHKQIINTEKIKTMINFFKALWPNEADSGFEWVFKVSCIILGFIILCIFAVSIGDLIYESLADG
jgi:hypothetical protein